MRKVVILILLTYIFSVGMRLFYIDKISNNPIFKDNGEYIINTNDGYFYAQGAKDIMTQKYKDKELRAKFDNSGYNDALSKITATIVKLTGLKLESVIFYLSAFLSSLIVIPIILLGYTLGMLEVGVVAALLSSIAWSYYNRTMLGYYDTDMLNIVFPAFLLWSLIASIVTKKGIYLLITALEIIAYRWWYPQSYSIEFSMTAMLMLYFATFIYFKKDYFINYKVKEIESSKIYYIALISFMLISISSITPLIKTILVVALFGLYYMKLDLIKKYIWYIAGVSVLLFLITGGLTPIVNKLHTYIFSSSVVESNEGLHLHFFNVFKTISEASSIPLDRVAKRISGDMLIFLLSFIGYILLLIRHRYFILALPLIALGVLAYSGGLRFTIYAIVPLAFGIAYLIDYIANYVKNNFKKWYLYYATLATLTLIILYPNIAHIFSYDRYIAPVFTEPEIKTLKVLKKEAKSKDYILSWWDYGYPLKFYSGLNTLTDGAVHGGDVNYPISYILTKPQEKAAKMARVTVEYHENRFKLPLNNPNKKRSDIEYMILDNGYKNPNSFLSNIENIKLPNKTRDIYLFLPDRMMRIVPVVEEFSNLDLTTGKSYQRSLFTTFRNYKLTTKGIIILPNRNYIDLRRGILSFSGQKVPINKFITTYYKNNKLQKVEKIYDISSNINIIFMRDSKRFIILDDKMLNSTYIQLFVLENYNSKYFEPVILTPLAKIYRLKI